MVQTRAVRSAFVNKYKEHGKQGDGKLQSQGTLPCWGFTKSLPEFSAHSTLIHVIILQAWGPHPKGNQNERQTGAHIIIHVTKIEVSYKVTFQSCFFSTEYKISLFLWGFPLFSPSIFSSKHH